MPPVDCARWTITLTASYLAITAALIAVLGNGVPGRAWLVAAHLTLFGALLILNRARPSAGILRVIRDWHPWMLFPLLYKEVELFFILLPVDSPYYLSPRLGPPLSGHFFFDLVHQMSARGGARGGAFPSAHVSGAVVVSLVAWRHQRRLAYLVVLLTASLMIAAVYGRFHYVLDTLAGAGLAIAVVTAYRYLHEPGL
jgi:membrane-associated phospholipid phosphatase